MSKYVEFVRTCDAGNKLWLNKLMNEKYKIEINTINLATTTCRLELIKDFAFG
jgi:hypothetical protein